MSYFTASGRKSEEDLTLRGFVHILLDGGGISAADGSSDVFHHWFFSPSPALTELFLMFFGARRSNTFCAVFIQSQSESEL